MLLAYKEQQVLQARLALQVTRGQLAQLVQQVLLDILVAQVLQALQVMMEQQVQQVPLDILVLLEQQVLRVTLGQRAPPVQ